MKKSILLFSLFIILSLISCSNDDDTPSFSEEDLIGRWYFLENENSEGMVNAYGLHQEMCEKDYVEFFANGTSEIINFVNNMCDFNEDENTWILEGNQLSFFENDYTIIVLTDTDLEIKSNDTGSLFRFTSK